MEQCVHWVACVYLICSEEKKKSFFILYSIFILVAATGRASPSGSRQDRQCSLSGQFSWLSLQTCQWERGGGKQNHRLPLLPASTYLHRAERQHRCCWLRASALEGHRDPLQGVSIRWACLEGLAGGNEVSRSRSFCSMPTKWRLKLAQDAGNHFVAWELLHLHPICASTSHAKEQGSDTPWACLVEDKAPYGSWWLNLTLKGIWRERGNTGPTPLKEGVWVQFPQWLKLSDLSVVSVSLQ